MKRMRGFTLIELIVTVAVIGILAAVAIPSFQAAALKNRASSEANAVLSLMNLTRSEAIKRNAQIVMCKSADGITCSAEVAVTWNQGVLIFVDNGAGAGGVANDETLNGSEAVIRTEYPLSKGSAVIGEDNFAQSVIYRSDGRLYDASGSSGGANASFRIVPGEVVKYGKAIRVNVNGRPSISPLDPDES